MELIKTNIIPHIGLGFFIEKERDFYFGHFFYYNIIILCFKLKFQKWKKLELPLDKQLIKKYKKLVKEYNKNNIIDKSI